jgi:hypothetical protein
MGPDRFVHSTFEGGMKCTLSEALCAHRVYSYGAPTVTPLLLGWCIGKKMYYQSKLIWMYILANQNDLSVFMYHDMVCNVQN